LRAARPYSFAMRSCWAIAALLVAVSGLADDRCDITLRPAATLLLPYFDVDVNAPQQSAAQTLFTIQNASRFPQIAAVTLWTDWGHPVVRFNVFLTGYDVQGINLYDIFVHATIVPGPYPGVAGTSSDASVPRNATSGSQPLQNDANPKISLQHCSYLPGVFSQLLKSDLQLVFTTGKASGHFIPCPKPIGGVHAHAIGYATIDVASACSTSLPSEPSYWSELLYDNVFAGDYQQITPRDGGLTVQSGSLVHIRATDATLPRTFYERFAPQMSDRRQPLPSVFVPRIVSGGGFNTTLKIWREVIASGAYCSPAYSSNAYLPFVDEVRFDEHENATLISTCILGNCPPGPSTAVVSAIDAKLGWFPPAGYTSDVGGWFYLNFGSQSWVIVTMSGDGIFNATDLAAPALANGCTAAPKAGAQIGPLP